MIINSPGAEFIYDGASYKIGDRIIGTSESEYEGLFGSIFEIRDGEDKETENETPEIYCSFEEPILPHQIKKLEEIFSELYQEPKKLEDIPLDFVIMAPDMVCVILPDPKHLTQTIYSVQEEWADRGEYGSSVSQAYTSEESALQFLIKQLREEMEEGLVSCMRGDKTFVEESYDDSYECFIDEDYYENHYRIYITSQPTIVTPEFVREMAEIYHLSMFAEDFESMLAQEEDITPDEAEWLMAQSDTIGMIGTSLKKNDSFWECYWNILRNTAEQKLEEYRKNNNSSERNGNNNGIDNLQ